MRIAARKSNVRLTIGHNANMSTTNLKVIVGKLVQLVNEF